jgi:hypothetical protein
MAVLQSNFGEDITFGYPGMEADGELSNIITRVLESATCGFGKAVFRGANDRGAVTSQTLVGAGTAAAGNVGTSTITASPTVGYGARIGQYKILQLVTGATGTLAVYDPLGNLVAHGVIGTAITTIPSITSVTVTNGGTATAGDTFYIAVTGNELLGFTIANRSLPVTSDRAADTFIANDNLRIKNRGKIWVLAGANVADGDGVFVTSAGAITNVAAGNLPATGWQFDDTALSGAPVRLVRR